jgi:hypothetical protein
MRPLAAVVVPAAVVFTALAVAGSASAQDLQAPPPLSASSYTPPPSNTSDQSQDSGLGLEWVYLNADVGGAYTNMRSFSESNLALNETSSGGAALGLAAGVRLLFFTLGVRARDLLLSNYNLWELDGEAAFHIRVWRIDPYFGFRGGYAFVGSLGSGVASSSNSSSPDVTVHGFNVGPMVGIDVYISSLVSIGVDANAEVLFLKRPPAPLPAGVTPAEEAMLPAQEQELYKLSGSCVGFGAVAAAHLGIHF